MSSLSSHLLPPLSGVHMHTTLFLSLSLSLSLSHSVCVCVCLSLSHTHTYMHEMFVECVCVWCVGGRPTNAAVLCFLEVPLSNKGENRGEPGTDEIGSGEGAHATLLSWVL
jgi:hypothetical protein